MNLTPRISVIIPIHNQGNFITDAINSVLKQDFSQDEIDIIVIDDGSTDNTQEVINNFKVRGVRYIYQPNQGKAIAIKTAMDVAQGKYIFNLDADDIFLPDKIRKVVAIFENDNKITYI